MALRGAVVVLVCVACWAGSGAVQAQPPAAPDWSGLYLGGGVGTTMGESHATTDAKRSASDYFADPRDFPQIGQSGDGHLAQWRTAGGIEVGFGRQFGNVLIGIAASANTLSLDESRSAGQAYGSDPTTGFTIDQRVKADWQWTLRPRLGWAQDNWLAYVTGGLAVTRVTLDVAFEDNRPSAGTTGTSAHSSDSETKHGWALGLGGEYALEGPWSLRGDYLYADFGSVDTVSEVKQAAGPINKSNVLYSSADLRTHTMLIGLTYRFGGL